MSESDLRRFGAGEKRYGRIALLVGVVGLAAAIVWAMMLGKEGHGMQRFAFAYLTAFLYVLSISVGAIAFLLLTYLFRGGWQVLFRRVPEVLGANAVIVGIMALPIVGFVMANNGMLYSWAQPIDQIHYPMPLGEHSPFIYGQQDGETREHPPASTVAPDPHSNAAPQDFTIVPVQAHHPATPDAHGAAEPHASGGHASAGGEHGPPHMIVDKRPWLNIPFFCLRLVLYMVVLGGMGLFLWRNSVMQDETGDPQRTRRAEVFAAPGTLAFGLVVTYMTFDLIMSLDWTWYSTIFGVYYFAGSMIAGLAVIILLSMRLKRLGYLGSMSREHFHDLGKLLFGFIFFWAYIAYSQYVLIWYGSMPNEVGWYALRGVTTVSEQITPISYVALLLLFGHLVIPFLALLSRHVKRRRFWLGFWAAWMLVMHYVDIWWLIMPQFEHQWIALGPIEIGCLLGLLGLFAASALKLMSQHSLVPLHDPRMAESLRFHNM